MAHLGRPRRTTTGRFFARDGNGSIEQSSLLDALHKLELSDTAELDRLLQSDPLGLKAAAEYPGTPLGERAELKR